ncbi:DUF3987 domain-containing protein [Parachlamydia sp.]|uniref:YfjI family protein n=1 Tax=Parachlamydia sp. TaxID=2052048 RepID=UPI003D0F9DD2
MTLPSIVKKEHLTYQWYYKNERGEIAALVTRHDNLTQAKQKKWFHQYYIDKNGNWVEGAVTPSPLFGIDTLPKNDSDEKVYIFEGEKCAQAAHHLNLPAITSMMGSNQSHLADWAVLARYRHLKDIVLIPDNDAAGKKYIKSIYDEIQKACPYANIWVLILPNEEKGADFIDWIQSNSYCPPEWKGFGSIDDPHSLYLKQAFEVYVKENLVLANEYFVDSGENCLAFENDPEPIHEILSEVLPCPIETLPDQVKNWIQTLIDQMQMPPDYIAAALIVHIGSLIGRKRGLELRRGTKWTEFPNLWGMLIGKPSSMKSVAMQSVIKPLVVLADQARIEYKQALKRFQIELEAWEIRKKTDLDGYRDSYKGSKTKGSAVVEYKPADPPEKPKQKRYKSDDPTVEKLGIILAENPQGILLYRDELAGWLSSFQKKGRENDRPFFLEGWSGKQGFEVDRIGREVPHIEAVCISILGGIQPGPVAQYIYSAIKGGLGDDGFIQRFQIMIWPDTKSEWELIENTDLNVWESYIHQIFNTLDQLQFNDGQPVILSFSREAQVLFDQWQKELETRLRKGDLPPYMEAHLAKYKKLLPALCLIFAHIQAALDNEYPQDITKECLQKSLLWLKYFESHACRVYGSSSNAIPKAATDLIRRIQRNEVQVPFTARDIYHGRHWSGLSNVNEVEEVLEYLIEKSCLQSSTVQTNGRSTKKYWVHPQILEQIDE